MELFIKHIYAVELVANCMAICLYDLEKHGKKFMIRERHVSHRAFAVGLKVQAFFICCSILLNYLAGSIQFVK